MSKKPLFPSIDEFTNKYELDMSRGVMKADGKDDHALMMQAVDAYYKMHGVQPQGTEALAYGKTVFAFTPPQSRQVIKSMRFSEATAKEAYLAEIRTVAPSYTPSFTKEPKIGPSMKQAGNTYEANRKKRIEEVEFLRRAKELLPKLDAYIAKLELAEQESAAGVASTSAYTPPITPIVVEPPAPPMGEPPLPKLESPPQAGSGQDTVLNVNGFAPSRSIGASKVRELIHICEARNIPK